MIEARERLMVALDLPTVAAAEATVARLGEAVTFYKIGYQLIFAGGLSLARTLAAAGKQVFVDAKLHDIGNTVARGVESVAKLGPLQAWTGETDHYLHPPYSFKIVDALITNFHLLRTTLLLLVAAR